MGASSKGVFGTGVTVALDPRTLGTQIDDGIMDKNLDAKLLLMNKNYFLNIRTQILDGRIFITGKVDDHRNGVVKLSKKDHEIYARKLKSHRETVERTNAKLKGVA